MWREIKRGYHKDTRGEQVEREREMEIGSVMARKKGTHREREDRKEREKREERRWR